MGIWGKKDEESSKHSNLDVPSSLPDTLIEQYGIDERNLKKEKNDYEEHPKKIPSDLTPTKEFLEKMHDDSSKIEFIKEEPSTNFEEDKNNTQENEEKNNKENIIKENINNSSKPAEIPSFFGELEKRLGENKHEVEKHFSTGLVDMMKKFHSARSRGEHFFFHEQELEDALYKKMLKLKEIEQEWIIRAKEYNSAKELLQEKETEIEIISQELKKLIKKAEHYKLFNKNVTHEKAFKLKDEKILLSINDLIHELEIMNDEVFNYHVNSQKNDFADWILHVFIQENLSKLIRSTLHREEMLKLLKEY